MSNRSTLTQDTIASSRRKIFYPYLYLEGCRRSQGYALIRSVGNAAPTRDYGSLRVAVTYHQSTSDHRINFTSRSRLDPSKVAKDRLLVYAKDNDRYNFCVPGFSAHAYVTFRHHDLRATINVHVSFDMFVCRRALLLYTQRQSVCSESLPHRLYSFWVKSKMRRN